MDSSSGEEHDTNPFKRQHSSKNVLNASQQSGTSTQSLQPSRKKSKPDIDDLDDVESLVPDRAKKYRHKKKKDLVLDDVESVFDASERKRYYPRRKRNSIKESHKAYWHAMTEPSDFGTLTQNLTNLSILNETEKVAEEMDSLEPAIPALPVDEEVFYVGVAPNVVRSKNEIADAPIPDYFYQNKEFEILITNIHSPYKFWFVLNDQTTEFLQMTNRMDDFYRSCDKSYEMRKVNVKKGQVAAYRGQFGWRRVVILSNSIGPNDNADLKVSVFLLDYGEINVTSVRNLCFLDRQFAVLPRQSFRGRLALVSPTGEGANITRWKFPDATNEFFKLCDKAILNAKVYAWEDAEKIFHLVLYWEKNRYTFGSIQNILAYQGYCNIYTPDEEAEYWPFKDELYPTFDMLEEHDYYTFDELLTSVWSNYGSYPIPNPDTLKRHWSEENINFKLQNCFFIRAAAEGMRDEHY